MKIVDITDLLFPVENLTPEQIRKEELWDQATQEAYRIIRNSSPIKLLQKTKEIYRTLSIKEGIKYEE
jgi:hypothetical protein